MVLLLYFILSLVTPLADLLVNNLDVSYGSWNSMARACKVLHTQVVRRGTIEMPVCIYLLTPMPLP